MRLGIPNIFKGLDEALAKSRNAALLAKQQRINTGVGQIRTEMERQIALIRVLQESGGSEMKIRRAAIEVSHKNQLLKAIEEMNRTAESVET
jgi:hypothetical protein